LALKAGLDDVIVDLPPQVGSGIASALLIADLFVIPVTPSGVDLRATGKALDLLRRARAVRGADQPACLLVPSRVDRRTSIGRRIQDTLRRFNLSVGPPIRQRAAHAEAFDAGAWVGEHAPNSPAHREVEHLKESVLETLDSRCLPSLQEAAFDPLPTASAADAHMPERTRSEARSGFVQASWA
jgi:chromosome partitioning protein